MEINGSETLPKDTVHHIIYKQVKATCEHDPETFLPWVNWTETDAKWKTALWLDKSKTEINIGFLAVLRLSLHLCICCHKTSSEVLEKHMNPSRWYLIQGRPCVFKKDNAEPQTASITKAVIHGRSIQMLDWWSCSPDISPAENIWCLMKWKIWQRTKFYAFVRAFCFF